MKHALNLIDGRWIGDPSVERFNPARPDEAVVAAPDSREGDMKEAIAAAVQAQASWAATPAPARGAVLMDAAELLRARLETVAVDLVREEGKTLAEARGEVRRAVDVLRFFGSLGWAESGAVLPSVVPKTSIEALREPLGVVGLITPWNFPIAIPAWKTAPALISGNAVVLKPAQLTPLSVNHLAAALLDAGLPAGVLNVVHGSGSTLGPALAQDPDVGGVSFTGSTAVGLSLHHTLSARRARVQLEMGGKNAYLVLDDADAVCAAQLITTSGFALTGQACTATSRVYCTPGLYPRLAEELAAAAARLVPGDGLAQGTDMGAVVSASQLATDEDAVRRATADGATVLAGGNRREGQVFEPTVLAGLAHDHDVVREEIFGPVVALLEVSDLDEGVARVNDSEYGLTAGICTNDLSAAHDFAARAQVGVVKVNRPTTGLDLHAPFGGVKDSSSNTFREQGHSAIDFYTTGKTVYFGHD